MTYSATNKSLRIAAKVAGFSYLITFAIVVYVNFGILGSLIVKGNAAETVHNILAHEQLFRIGIVGDIIYCVGFVMLLTALYVILKPINHYLALLATFLRFLWVLTWLVITLHLFDALKLLSGADYLRAFEAERLQGLVIFYLSSYDYYYVGLLFMSLASTICGYLWLKSRFIPQALAVFVIISSTWCVLCTILFYIFPDFNHMVNLNWFDMPMSIFDIVLSFWLLFKGLSVSTPKS